MQPTKQVVFFYYDGFVEFEIALAFLYLTNRQIRTVAFEQREYRSHEGQRFIPDTTLATIDPKNIDLFVIPGGNPLDLLDHPRLRRFIGVAMEANAIIAGICGGVDILVSMGFLAGKRCIDHAFDPSGPEWLEIAYRATVGVRDDVVSDGNLITAQGEAYSAFARVLANRLGISDDKLPFVDTDWLPCRDGWTDVGDSVKVSTGLFEECNLTLIVSGSDALLVDTGYRIAEATRVLDYLSRCHLTLQGIVITHHHPDHEGNLDLFRTSPLPVYDIESIGDGRRLQVGSKTIRMFPTPGHHPLGDISVSVEEDRILIAGDILFSCLPPMLGYGAQPAILRKTLESIADRHERWIVPGHGRVMTGDAITAMALSYMDRVEQRVKAVVESQGTEDDLTTIKLSECMDHMEWMVEEPSVDLHRQNKQELYASIKNQR